MNANEITSNCMKLLKDGKVRNHKLLYAARIHAGQEELEEYRIYREFLQSKNCVNLIEMRGNKPT